MKSPTKINKNNNKKKTLCIYHKFWSLMKNATALVECVRILLKLEFVHFIEMRCEEKRKNKKLKSTYKLNETKTKNENIIKFSDAERNQTKKLATNLCSSVSIFNAGVKKKRGIFIRFALVE